MANPENSGPTWNLIINSRYLLIANPFYNTHNHPNPTNNFGSGFNGAGHTTNLNEDSRVNLDEHVSNLESPVVGDPSKELAENVGNAPTVLHDVLSENRTVVLPENVVPENIPPIAPALDAGFNPNDRRLVIQFLAKRLRNEPLEKNCFHEINFYDFPPQHIADNYIHAEPGVLHFFTPVRRFSNSQAVRSIPGEWGGKWIRASGYVAHIKGDDNVVFNIKSFKFVPKNPNPNDVLWIMKEYSLSNEKTQPRSDNIHECVAVKLYRN